MTFDDELALNKIAADERKIASMAVLLQELDDYFDDEVDIIDGESGPLPNEAMHWQQRIREVLGTSKF